MPLQRLPRSARKSRDLATLESVINTAGLALWSCGVDRKCTYISEYWTTLTGHPRESALGDGWKQFVVAEDLERVAVLFRKGLERREPVTAEYRLRRRDGSLLWARDHGTPIFRNGQFEGYVGTILDIDDRKRLEEHLRAANERFALATRGTNDGIWDWDLVAQEGYASERCAEILGRPPADLCQYDRYMSYVHPRDRDRVHAAVAQHLRDATPYDVEYRWRMPQGGYRWVRTRGKAVRDEAGNAVRMAGATGDITDRKRAERRVELLNRRLTASNEALQRQSELLADLAQRTMEAGEQERRRVARELHDDLIQKLAYLQLRVASLAQATPALQQPLVEVEKLAESIVEDVRRVARDLHSSVLDHLGLERALRSYCADAAASGKLAIRVQRKGRVTEPPPAVGLCLYRVAQEAIRNAMRHSGSARVAVTLTGTAATLVLRIEDWGNGFEPSAVGAGLGLTSMAERVRLAGGALRLLTRPGKGTLVEATIAWAP